MKKTILLVLTLFFSINTIYSAIFISGLEYPETHNSEQTLKFNTTLINSEEKIFSDLTLKYALVNLENLGVVHQNSEQFSFAKKEVKFITKEIDTTTIPSGQYSLNVIVAEKTGAPIAGLKYNIEITNSNIQTNEKTPKLNFEIFPHILAKDEKNKTLKTSFGSLGNNLPKSSQKYVKFSLENPETLDLNTKIELYHSYAPDKKLEEFAQPLSIKSDKKTYELNLKYEKPGTYIVKTTFYKDTTKLFSKELRMVIEGESASIVSVTNKQDTYDSNQEISLTGTLIGPADGASTLTNLKLNLEIIQNDKTILTQSESISEIGFQPVDFNLKKITPSALTNYKVIITLLNSANTELDKLELNYEKLEPEFLYKNGTIYKADFKGCFNDDICTAEEKNMGNCYDCDPNKLKEIQSQKDALNKENKNPNNPNTEPLINPINYTMIILISILLIIVIAVGYFILKGIEGKKQGGIN